MTQLIRRSALEAFACPAYFHDKYIDGLNDSSPAAQRGTAFHECAHRYIELLLEANADHDPVLAARALEEGLSMRPMGWDLQQDVRSNLWPRFAETFRLNLTAFVAAEDSQNDGVTTWRPDLVYALEDLDMVEIWDWKTHFVSMREDEARQSFQALFYAWSASKTWPGFTRYRMRFVFPRLGVETIVEFTPAELDDFRDRVDSLLDQIRKAKEADYWPEIPGLHCRYCVRTCSVADDPRRVPLRLASEGEASSALQRLVVIRRQEAQLVDALKGYCETQGPIAVGGVEARFDSKLTRHWNLVDVIDTLASHGVDDLSTLPRMRVSASTLQPLLKVAKRAAIRDALMATVETHTSAEFVVKIPKDPGQADAKEQE